MRTFLFGATDTAAPKNRLARCTKVLLSDAKSHSDTKSH